MYSIGQIFKENELPHDLAGFCNESQYSDNPCYIKEIEPLDGVRRFQIERNEEPTQEELNQMRIAELERYLSLSDWYVVRYTETGVEIPGDVRQQRQSAREEISSLREQINNENEER